MPPAHRPPEPAALARRFALVRAHSLALVEPLSIEDQALQSMPDASPSKWHLAHCSWFFETLVLLQHQAGYTCFDARFAALFNSYYEVLGPRHPRPQRGLLTRPAHAEVLRYRQHVDQAMQALLSSQTADTAGWPALAALIELGLQHEQQHQELLLTDALHLLHASPLLPAYGLTTPQASRCTEPLRWLRHEGGIVEIGAGPEVAFCYDNERGRHQQLLRPFAIANRPVNCAEYADFIAAGGYRDASLWLSDGWALVQAQGWESPAYWHADACTGGWQVFGLQGLQPLDPLAPVSQLSYYEAEAYARWADARLPSEFEWECAARELPGMRQLDDAVWQWTGSAYLPYPGFKPFAGAAAEYNGKFMVGQMVLRGGSLATPPGHSRPSYRNFFPPAARWQFSGLRLAREL